MTAEFAPLDKAEQSAFVELREQLRAIHAQPNGLEWVLNALVAVGHEFTTLEIAEWLKGVEEIDLRDLNAFCYDPERLIVVPDPEPPTEE